MRFFPQRSRGVKGGEGCLEDNTQLISPNKYHYPTTFTSPVITTRYLLTSSSGAARGQG